MAQIFPPLPTPTGSPDSLPPPVSSPLPCPACGSPRSSIDRFCHACGLPFVESSSTNTPPSSPASLPTQLDPTQLESPHSSRFHCQNCGCDLEVAAQPRSFSCPFCDSNYVVHIERSDPNRRAPEFVIGFSISREQAQQKYLDWIGKNAWFRPKNLRSTAVVEKQRGVYIPFWHFSFLAKSTWSARIGEYWYRTETYTTTNHQGKRITQTRTVQETEWWPLRGNNQNYYFGYLVSGSKGLTQPEALKIQPFDLKQLQRYHPYFLAGWLAEEYSVPFETAESLAKTEFANREQAAIRGRLPGDTQRDLRVETHFERSDIDLILLPVHVLSYHFNGKAYRFLVNGQTGQIHGDKPISVGRILLVALGIPFVIALLVFLATLFLAQF